MIETVVSMDLFVDEKMIIKKNRLLPFESDHNTKRISIVTGIHGDELEGQYICFELIRRIKEQPECLKGIVDIYPAVNPLGIDSISRGMPMFDLDMNRIFPGSQNGAVAELVASNILEDIAGASLCLDLHSSNIFLREIPQVRINEETSDQLLEYAKQLDVDLIWVDSSDQRHHATLAQSLNNRNVPTIMSEMGVGMRITKEYGSRLVNSILKLMKSMDMWDGDIKPFKTPPVVTDKAIHVIHAKTSGTFLPDVTHTQYVKENQRIGIIFDSLKGEILEEILATKTGKIITLREYPVVYEGSLITRILEGDKDE